jgi:hypothetical protein
VRSEWRVLAPVGGDQSVQSTKSRFRFSRLSPPSIVWPAWSAMLQSQYVAASCRSYKRNRAPVQAEEKVAAYLMRLSSAASYRHLGAVFDMSETHVPMMFGSVAARLGPRFSHDMPPRSVCLPMTRLFCPVSSSLTATGFTVALEQWTVHTSLSGADALLGCQCCSGYLVSTRWSLKS